MNTSQEFNLDAAIQEYLLRLIDQGYSHHTCLPYQRLLARFSAFVQQQAMGWEEIFTVQSVESFANHCRDRRLYPAIRGLARYLHSQGQLARPLTELSDRLPEIYEGYLMTRGQVWFNIVNPLFDKFTFFFRIQTSCSQYILSAQNPNKAHQRF